MSTYFRECSELEWLIDHLDPIPSDQQTLRSTEASAGPDALFRYPHNLDANLNCIVCSTLIANLSIIGLITAT